MSGKHSQKFLDHVKQSTTDGFETASKRAIQKTAEATSDLIGNKIANKITKVSQNSQQNNSEISTNEHDKKSIYNVSSIYKLHKRNKQYTNR